MTYHYTNDPAEIAAGLRQLAEAFDRLTDVELPVLSVELNVQAVAHEGTDQSRRDGVDQLARALADEAPREVINGLYRTGLVDGPHPVSVTVYTAIAEAAELTGGAA